MTRIFPSPPSLLLRACERQYLSFYRFARAADDIADHPALSESDKFARLDSLEQTLLGKSDKAKAALPLRSVLRNMGLAPPIRSIFSPPFALTSPSAATRIGPSSCIIAAIPRCQSGASCLTCTARIAPFGLTPTHSVPPCRRCRCSTNRKPQVKGYSEETLEALSRQVEFKLKDFRIEAQVVGAHPGPVITRFEMQPAPGVKGSQISSLDKDIARGLSVVSVRVVDVIPGQVGDRPGDPEHAPRDRLPRRDPAARASTTALKSPLALALGKDIGGAPVVVDLREDAAPAGRRHHRFGQVGRASTRWC